jgi:glycolate oxidase FAD binding subunit
MLKPLTIEALQQSLTQAKAAKSRIESVDLSAINRILEHTPEDMTVTVQGGAILSTLQAEVRKRGQWLPIDPPDTSITIQQLLATNASGPRRFGYGTVRDYVIGLTIAMADGRLVHSGGKVVKNVAGYDLMKLFIGDQGTLGIVVEVTFKLRPVPETERLLQQRCDSIAQAQSAVESVISSPITPVVLDIHNAGGLSVILGFDGTRHEMDWQITKAAELGFTESATLDYDKSFQHKGAHKLSVLPSKLADVLTKLGKAPFIARAGNGVVYYQGKPISWPTAPIPKHLQQRVKDTFDPNHIFPDLP